MENDKNKRRSIVKKRDLWWQRLPNDCNGNKRQMLGMPIFPMFPEFKVGYSFDTSVFFLSNAFYFRVLQ